MKIKKLSVVLAAALACSMLFSGCSVNQTVEKLKSAQETDIEDETATESVVAVKEPGKTVDDSLEAPSFVFDMTGETIVTPGTEVKINCPATVTDGGEVTYQWYKNNVDSNGGGTEIEGQTSEVLTVDTSETGSVFYYVVANNIQGDRINMSVSTTYEITVIEEGTWTADQNGNRYILPDNTYPADTTIWIGNTAFTLNADGYRTDDGQPITDPTVVLQEMSQVQAAADAAAAAATDPAAAATDPAAAATDPAATTDAAATDPAAATDAAAATDEAAQQ